MSSLMPNYLKQVYFMQQAILQIRAQAEYQQQEQLAIQVGPNLTEAYLTLLIAQGR